MPPLAARLINRGISPTVIITAALLLLAAGNVWLVTLHPAISIAALSAPLLTLGAGVRLAAGIIDAQAMNQIETDQAGLAAGMLNTIDGVANTLIMTLFGAALIAFLTLTLNSPELAGQVATGNMPSEDAEILATHLTAAWRTALLALAGLCTAAAITTAIMVRNVNPRQQKVR